jgi:hypothetical protein
LFSSNEPAAATAWAGAYSFWNVSSSYYYDYTADVLAEGLPVGFVVTCSGNATANPDSQGCNDYADLYVQNSSGSNVIQSLHREGDLHITNTTDRTFIGYIVFTSDFSAFNPGGYNVGASIDVLGRERAAFESEVFGEGVHDMHQCDTDFIDPTDHTTYISPTQCGVNSPDESMGEAVLNYVDPFQEVILPYTINIRVEARGLPEPRTLNLFLASLPLIEFARRRKRNSHSTVSVIP